MKFSDVTGSIQDILRANFYSTFSAFTQVVMNRLAGTVFVGLALKLATADR
jgi:threonine/homoserine/homoserine lactone efflux protein